MQKGICLILLSMAWALGFVLLAQAEMTSENYRVTTNVVSSGGGPMGSAGYDLDGTVGQPSPLMDPADPPFSTNYDMYPGFWNVVAAYASTCPGDFNGDNDVDGSDLAAFADDPGDLDLDEFALNFGKIDCP
jgi:hypothetical protein